MAEINFGNILGGVNYSVPPNELPQYYLADAQNIVPTLNGYAKARNGSSVLNGAPFGAIITSFHELIRESVSYKYAVSGKVVGYLDGNFFVTAVSGLTDGAYGQWLNYGDYAIYVNGVDRPQKLIGLTGDDLTSDADGLAGASCIAEWGERVWVAVGAKLYGSALRAPTDFSTNIVDIGYWECYVGNKNEPITGLFTFFDMLLIGKKNQLYMMVGAPETKSSTFRLQPIQTQDKDSIGFTAKNAITQVGNDAIFLDGFDVKRFSGIAQYGDIESTSIIANIKDYFKSSGGAGLDKDYLQYAHFFHYKHGQQVWCSIPTGATSRYWFVIDYGNTEIRRFLQLPMFSFYPMAGLTPICFGGVVNGSMVDIYAGCIDGYVRKLDSGIDDSNSAVDAYVAWGFGLPSKKIQPVGIGLNVKFSGSCSLQPSYAMGLQDWSEVIDDSNYTNMAVQDLTDASWRGNGEVVYKKMASFLSNTDRSFVFKIRHNTAGEVFELRKSYFQFRGKQRY